MNKWISFLSYRCSFFIIFIVIACLAVTGCAIEPPIPSHFYSFDRSKPLGKPGDILSSERFSGAPAGASAFRVLYTSTGLNDKPIVVSGVIIVPTGIAPLDGRNIIAWAHPTTGVARRCAPSLLQQIFNKIPGLIYFLEHGYIVTATDYPGLGTNSPPSYLVGLTEGRAVLDSVRAVYQLVGTKAGSRVVLWGHSQGGHAVLFAGQLAASYAPELSLAGIAAAAPATHLATLFNDDFETDIGKILTAYTLWSWSKVYSAHLNGIIKPSALPIVEQISTDCIESSMEAYRIMYDARPLGKTFLKNKPYQEKPWSSFIAANEPGQLHISAPLLITQGMSDQIVLPKVTADFVKDLCKSGETVNFVKLPKVGHITAGEDSAAIAAKWITNRFAKKSAPNDCLKQ